MLKKDRMDRILERSEADMILITDPWAILYLCEKRLFPGERFLGVLIGKDREPVLFLNELFRFDEEIGIRKLYCTDNDTAAGLLKKEIGHTGILGVDKTFPARFLLPVMEAGIADKVINGSFAVDKTRAIKDEEEKALMRESSRINDEAMARFKKFIRPDITEKETAAQVMDIYRQLGAEAFSFPPIVAFGANAADPHHMPDDTVLKEGDTVLFDVGCKYHGYCSDMTRTFFYKKDPSPEQKRVYGLVKRANEDAEAAVRPGVKLCDIDRIARDIITEGGFGKDFTHRLGHFIGLEDHEYGDVSQSFEDLTEAGNIFSIEPGIYNKEILGCRIEDLVLVTDDGCEILNQYPHEIEIIE